LAFAFVCSLWRPRSPLANLAASRPPKKEGKHGLLRRGKKIWPELPRALPKAHCFGKIEPFGRTLYVNKQATIRICGFAAV